MFPSVGVITSVYCLGCTHEKHRLCPVYRVLDGLRPIVDGRTLLPDLTCRAGLSGPVVRVFFIGDMHICCCRLLHCRFMGKGWCSVFRCRPSNIQQKGPKTHEDQAGCWALQGVTVGLKTCKQALAQTVHRSYSCRKHPCGLRHEGEDH